MTLTRRAAGFTLIELMVAVAIMGLLLAGMGAFLHGTLQFSSATIATSDRLRELNDGSGYVVDNLRRSSDVAYGDCTDPAGGGSLPGCAALVVPIERPPSTAIDGYVRLAYLRIPRGEFVAENPSVMPVKTWADDHTDVLVEYREEFACAASCTLPPADLVNLPSDGPYLVLDEINRALPRIFDPNANPGVTTLTLQEAYPGGLMPASSPLTITVDPRN